jgi:ABC-type Zn2+ transport system substrate-binding protein/surface adhesin
MTDRGKTLDRNIRDAHQRFTAAVAGRLPAMTPDQKERYFALLSKLVGKLEQKDKSLKQALQEVVPEVLPLILQELSGR